MSSIQETVSGPISIKMSDGATYKLDKIGLNIWCEFCEWLNTKSKAKAGTLVGLDAMLEAAMTMNGMRWLVWRSMHTHDNALDESKVGELIGSMTRMTEVFEAIADMPKDDDTPADPPKSQ